MKALVPLAAFTLLLPSCVYWDIGGNIRATAETQVAVDVSRPYRCGEELVVPECRYHESAYVASIVFPHSHDGRRYSYGAEYTGHYRAVRRGKYGFHHEIGERREVAGREMIPVRDSSGEPLPEGMQHPEPTEPLRVTFTDWWHVRDSEGEKLKERSAWYPLAVVASAPFDYAVDPALTLVTFPIAWIYLIAETSVEAMLMNGA